MYVNENQIDDYLPYMRDVIRCESALHELSVMWRIIESSAKMNCPTEAKNILPSMAETRIGFNLLEKDLITSLVNEKIKNILNKLNSKSQNLIDILVRNLYERTADIGFLATDNAICEFVSNPSASEKTNLIERLKAYKKKYTVYDEIIVLDTDGNVLANIDFNNKILKSSDTLIAQTILSDSYVETHRYTDLRPKNKSSLVYSKKILHPETGRAVGVLCLFFNIQEEMLGIFESYSDISKNTVMLLLDENNSVIDSSDRLWIPVGSIVPINHNTKPNLITFAGKEYLISTCTAKGYQGYIGPHGWQGQIMTPIEIAFKEKSDDILKSLNKEIAEGLLAHAESFCPPLFKAISAASTIRRVVWNGQVMTAGEINVQLKLKTILDQISETGARSNILFNKSINELYETVLSSSMKSVEFTAKVLVDLIDRNLYERANDCRWWAMTPSIISALEKVKIDAKTTVQLNNILKYINSLYTVYTSIYIYDSNGKVVSSTNLSNENETLIGNEIDKKSLENLLKLKSQQDYYVSDFTVSDFNKDSLTYIYNAAIRSTKNNEFLGGIGLIFDSKKEFLAMLYDGISNKANHTALYIKRNGLVISSTDSNISVGSYLELDKEIIALKNGNSISKVVIHNNKFAVMGCSASKGYREFKITDNYKEDFISVVYYYLGELHTGLLGNHDSSTIIQSNLVASNDPEFATFFIGNNLFAIEANNVTEAISSSEISAVSVGLTKERIGIIKQKKEHKDETIAWVFDLNYLLTGQPLPIENANQVIIVEVQNKKFGLLVGELHSVAQFNKNQIMPSPLSTENSKSLIKHIIKANQGHLLIQEVDVSFLVDTLIQPSIS